MSTPELNPTEALLDEQAWRAQYRAPNEALALGQALVATASTSAARSAGWWHQAFVLLRGGRLAEGRHALAQAWRAARQTAHRGGGVRWLARCRDAQSMVLRRSRKPRQALQLLQLNLALPLHARSERERYISHNLSALSAIALGELDDGLRHYMLALDAARQGGDVAMVANASANLCGLQSDLLNLEDAIPIAEEAVAAAESAGLAGQTVWFTALHNRAFTALAAGDAATAGDMASRMQQQAMSLPDGKRARYALLWAEADLVNGRSAEAEAWLAHSREHWREPDELLLEWSLVRARLDNQAGAFERARAVCDAARAHRLGR